MVHLVEELGNVHVDDVGKPLPGKALGGFHRIVGAASGTKSVTAFAETGFEHRPEHPEQKLLHEAILHVWDAQRAGSAAELGDVSTLCSAGLVAAL